MTTAKGQCIRFPVEDVRVFKGRDSIGVRGIRLADDDHLISMAILSPVEATPAERAAYLKLAAAARRAQIGADEEEETDVTEEADEEGAVEATEITQERFDELAAREEFVFTVSERGFGKRSSSYEYRTSGRGGKGIVAMVANERNGKLAASFPIEDSDQIMLVTDAGQLIRTTVDEVRIAGRNTQGVRIFRTDSDERVVSVERIRDVGENPDAEDALGGDGPGEDEQNDSTGPESNSGSSEAESRPGPEPSTEN
jgi:DNA gyrase subunit A